MTDQEHLDGMDAGEPAEAVESTPMPDPPETGDPRVDTALAALAPLADRPVADHVDTYEDVHRRLTDALADLDGG